ncbi:MAG: hypothetical protein CR979_00650 [Propionibacterium sp.]|nr:MAG: hypothetical protein CR979_00650 [Propionibacterium sp.]
MIKRVRHVVTENNRVLQAVELARKNQIVGLGELMNASHTSMRDDFEITVPTVDLAVTVAQQNGALGARMTGGGFGGCVIALCEIGTGEQIGNKINQAFTEASFEAPTWFIAKPSAGARRLR